MLDPFPRSFPECCGEVWIEGNLKHAFRHRLDIVLFNKESGLSVSHDVGNTGVARRDDRQAASPGFENADRRTLAVSGCRLD